MKLDIREDATGWIEPGRTKLHDEHLDASLSRALLGRSSRIESEVV